MNFYVLYMYYRIAEPRGSDDGMICNRPEGNITDNTTFTVDHSTSTPARERNLYLQNTNKLHLYSHFNPYYY